MSIIHAVGFCTVLACKFRFKTYLSSPYLTLLMSDVVQIEYLSYSSRLIVFHGANFCDANRSSSGRHPGQGRQSAALERERVLRAQGWPLYCKQSEALV